MSCKEKFESLSAYLDGELKGAELEAFREHLDGCAECRRELAEQEALWGLLGKVKVEAPSAKLTERIMGRLDVKPKKTRSLARTLGWAMPLAAAASLLVAVLVIQPGTPQAKLDPETAAMVEKLDVLEHLDVLENMELLQEAEKEPILIEDPDAAGTVLEGGGAS